MRSALDTIWYDIPYNIALETDRTYKYKEFMTNKNIFETFPTLPRLEGQESDLTTSDQIGLLLSEIELQRSKIATPTQLLRTAGDGLIFGLGGSTTGSIEVAAGSLLGGLIAGAVTEFVLRPLFVQGCIDDLQAQIDQLTGSQQY